METNQDQTAATPQLGRYEIDTDSSVVKFKTKHMFGLGSVLGTVRVRQGTIDVSEPIAESAISVQIDAASFDSGNPNRDRNVKSKTFLDTDNHPVLTFSGNGVTGTAITGTLTVKGASGPVTLDVTRTEVTADGFTAVATTRIDRLAFGVTGSRGMTGRFLDLTLEISCVRK